VQYSGDGEGKMAKRLQDYILGELYIEKQLISPIVDLDQL